MKRCSGYDYGFTAEMEIYGYSIGYAHGFMKGIVKILKENLAEKQITKKKYREFLDKNGFKDWSYAQIDAYIAGEKEAYNRIEKENSSTWVYYCKEGRKYIESKLEDYVKLQDKIIGIANEYELFRKFPVKLDSDYSGSIVFARSQRNKMYDRYRGSYLSKLLGIDENIIANIIHCVQYIDFDVYALDFVKENSKIYNHMYPVITPRQPELAAASLQIYEAILHLDGVTRTPLSPVTGIT